MDDTTAPDPIEPIEATDEAEPDGLLDRMRGTGVGVEDPTIVGDAGPTDVAPGEDPDGGALLHEGDDPGEV
ncbi:MAG TPA: hypothetical protein VGO60_09050 [Iamia sp.]|jgi:hypothetical protein|nr:hypothetical protein [Iamia sp.]